MYNGLRKLDNVDIYKDQITIKIEKVFSPQNILPSSCSNSIEARALVLYMTDLRSKSPASHIVP